MMQETPRDNRATFFGDSFTPTVEDEGIVLSRDALQIALTLPSRSRWIADWLFTDPNSPFQRDLILAPEHFETSLALQFVHDADKLHINIPQVRLAAKVAMPTVENLVGHVNALFKTDTSTLLIPVACVDDVTVGYALGMISTTGLGNFVGRFAFDSKLKHNVVVTHEVSRYVTGIICTTVKEGGGKVRHMLGIPKRQYSFFNLPNNVVFALTSPEDRIPTMGESDILPDNDLLGGAVPQDFNSQYLDVRNTFSGQGDDELQDLHLSGDDDAEIPPSQSTVYTNPWSGGSYDTAVKSSNRQLSSFREENLRKRHCHPSRTKDSRLAFTGNQSAKANIVPNWPTGMAAQISSPPGSSSEDSVESEEHEPGASNALLPLLAQFLGGHASRNGIPPNFLQNMSGRFSQDCGSNFSALLPSLIEQGKRGGGLHGTNLSEMLEKVITALPQSPGLQSVMNQFAQQNHRGSTTQVAQRDARTRSADRDVDESVDEGIAFPTCSSPFTQMIPKFSDKDVESSLGAFFSKQRGSLVNSDVNEFYLPEPRTPDCVRPSDVFDMRTLARSLDTIQRSLVGQFYCSSARRSFVNPSTGRLTALFSGPIRSTLQIMEPSLAVLMKQCARQTFYAAVLSVPNDGALLKSRGILERLEWREKGVTDEEFREQRQALRKEKNRLSAARSNEKRRVRLERQKRELGELKKRMNVLKRRHELAAWENERLKQSLQMTQLPTVSDCEPVGYHYEQLL